MFRDMSEVGHLGLGDYEAAVNADTDLDYLIHTTRGVVETNISDSRLNLSVA